ncbi:MAG: energy transducer TonB [Pseudomonadota bacterium]
MSLIRGLRYPTALVFGLLFTGAIFWSLWLFTNVTFNVAAIKTVQIQFSRTIVDTPPDNFQPETITQPPVFDTIDIGPLTEGPTAVATVVTKEVIGLPKLDGPVIGGFEDRDVQPLVRIEPEYPRRAIERGIEGWVTVQYTVSGTGAVTDVVVVESSPPNVFDDAAVKAVSRWRYNPKIEGTVAVERVGIQTLLRFELEEE